MARFRSIGIVGGMGPYTDLDLARKILNRTLATKDQDYFSTTICSYPGLLEDPPSFLFNKSPHNPGYVIGDIMLLLAKAGASIIGMPCNTAHHPRILMPALEKLQLHAPDVIYINLVQSVIRYIHEQFPNAKYIGILGTYATVATQVYHHPLIASDYIPLAPSEKGCNDVQNAISDPVFGIKAHASPVTPQARELLLREARLLIEHGAQALILGCTELPLALTEPDIEGVPLIDSTDVLAQALITAYKQVI